MNEVLYSSKSDEWATPQNIYDRLDEEFHFDLDPCSTEENHKCKEYYTSKENGLSQNWGGGAYSAIRRIAGSVNGWKRHTGKQERMEPLSFC